MTDTNGQAGPPPIQVQPQPLPLQWIISTATGQDGSKMVILQILSPQGSSVFFFPPEAAVGLGEQIRHEGQQAQSGLVIPQMPVPTDIRDIRKGKQQ